MTTLTQKKKTGKAKNEDEFPVNWHPHKGFDIASYLKSGTGRHGDSLGNRVTFNTPGMQWMSTGSGVEHAEGGANEKGQIVQGFQIWINVPSSRKLDDPRYGTVPSEKLPTVQVSDGCKARILAGEAFGAKGPFETVQPVQMIDFEITKGSMFKFNVAKGLDTTIVYLYSGDLEKLNREESFSEGSVILLDASSALQREIELEVHSDASIMIFAGKRIQEPIAWHGPIVMNTKQEISETLETIYSGRFPPKRVEWDYKVLASRPSDHNKFHN